MLIFKKGKVVLNNKKPKDIIGKQQMIFVEFLSCFEFDDQSKKSIKNTLNFFDNVNSFDDILNSNFLKEKNINVKEIFEKIKLLIESSKNLNKIKYFYKKDYDQDYDHVLLNYLKIHEETEKYFRKILKLKYSSFSPSLNRYVDYQKQR